MQALLYGASRCLSDGASFFDQNPQISRAFSDITGEQPYLELLDSIEWLSPRPQTKPIAMTHRGLVRFLGHAHRHGLLEKLEYPSRRGMKGH